MNAGDADVVIGGKQVVRLAAGQAACAYVPGGVWHFIYVESHHASEDVPNTANTSVPWDSHTLRFNAKQNERLELSVCIDVDKNGVPNWVLRQTQEKQSEACELENLSPAEPPGAAGSSEAMRLIGTEESPKQDITVEYYSGPEGAQEIWLAPKAAPSDHVLLYRHHRQAQVLFSPDEQWLVINDAWGSDIAEPHLFRRSMGHCTDCQRQAGASFTLSMVVFRSTIELLCGEPRRFDVTMYGRPTEEWDILRQTAVPDSGSILPGAKSQRTPFDTPPKDGGYSGRAVG